MSKRLRIPAAVDELLAPFVVRYPDPHLMKREGEAVVFRHAEVSRLRELCAEMIKRIREEADDTRFGDIDERLAGEAFILAAELEFMQAPIEKIRFERGKTNLDWQMEQHLVISAGPLPLMWPGHCFPEVKNVWGWRLRNPTSNYPPRSLEVYTAAIVEDRKTGREYDPFNHNSKAEERAEAIMILNRWVELLDRAMAASASGQIAKQLVRPDVRPGENSPVKADSVSRFISTVNQLIGALKDLPPKEVFGVAQPTYRIAEQLAVLAKELGFGFAPITFLENEADARASCENDTGEVLEHRQLINLAVPVPRMEVRDPFNAGTSAHRWDLLTVDLNPMHKAQLIATLKVWRRHVKAMRPQSTKSKTTKSRARRQPIRVSAGHLSPTDLATKYGTPAEATRKMLDRWRSRHTDGYAENDAPRPNEPRFLYLESAVAPAMRELRSRYTKRKGGRTKTSGQRPAE